MRGRTPSADPSTLPPVPADAPIAATVAQMSAPPRGAGRRPIPWSFLSLLARGGGVLLVFVGTLIDVIAGSYPADCFTSHCGGSTSAGIQYGILAARLLWSIGAFGLSAGAGIELHFLQTSPEGPGPEENARYLARRRAAYGLLLVGIGVLLVLLLTQGGAVAPAL